MEWKLNYTEFKKDYTIHTSIFLSQKDERYLLMKKNVFVILTRLKPVLLSLFDIVGRLALFPVFYNFHYDFLQKKPTGNIFKESDIVSLFKNIPPGRFCHLFGIGTSR